jgi:ribonuclease HII
MINYLTPQYELDILESGKYSKIVGIDEVGRGCWAGPVAVGAYIFESTTEVLDGIQDSKKLTANNRKEKHSLLKNHTYLVELASVEEIDFLGIGKTIEVLIQRIINKLSTPETLFLVDGQFSQSFGKNSKKVIHGDSIYYSIAAASILAKVERDDLMCSLDLQYPGYRFSKHKGYGTKEHRELIKSLGVCELHRRSYQPIKQYLENY